MTILQRAAKAAAAGVLLATVFSSLPVHAEDLPLIWDVSRLGENAVSFHTGVRLRSRFSPSVGADASIIASDKGAISGQGLPLRLWGNVKLSEQRMPAESREMILAAAYDPKAGASTLSLTRLRTWIATPSIDLQTSRVLEARAAGGEGTGVVARQTLRISLPDIRAALVSEGFVDPAQRVMAGSFSVEKSLMGDVTVSASVDDVLSRPSATFRAGFQRTW